VSVEIYYYCTELKLLPIILYNARGVLHLRLANGAVVIVALLEQDAQVIVAYLDLVLQALVVQLQLGVVPRRERASRHVAVARERAQFALQRRAQLLSGLGVTLYFRYIAPLYIQGRNSK
jgi:hypothetical protein